MKKDLKQITEQEFIEIIYKGIDEFSSQINELNDTIEQYDGYRRMLIKTINKYYREMGNNVIRFYYDKENQSVSYTKYPKPKMGFK